MATLAATVLWCGPRPAAAESYRIEATGGWAASIISGREEESFESITVFAEVNTLSAVAGPLVGATLWVDDWIAPHWSLGFQHLHAEQQASARVVVSGPGAGARVDAGFDVTLDTLFVDVAWRPREGAIHPFVGVGLGVGVATIDVTGEGAVRVGGVVFRGSSAGSTGNSLETALAGVQGFFGFDYDIWRNVYVGLNARVFYVDAHPLGTDIQFAQLATMAQVGFSF